MSWKNKLICIAFTWNALTSCNTGSNDARLEFEPVSDSLYNPGGSYKESSLLWQKYYEDCMYHKTMPDAFYLQLQDRIYIGSINNEKELTVNKDIHLIDTAKNKRLDLLGLINSANCQTSTLQLNSDLKKSFFDEVLRALNTSPVYKSLAPHLDSNEIKIKTGSLYHNALRLDSLIYLLNHPKDSSFVIFKQLLLQPENVILGQAVELFGFTAEFPVKGKLSPAEEKLLSSQPVFSFDNPSEKVKITLLADDILRIEVDKRYTVLGRFFKLKEG